jgi:hypothetical protein
MSNELTRFFLTYFIWGIIGLHGRNWLLSLLFGKEYQESYHYYKGIA